MKNLMNKLKGCIPNFLKPILRPLYYTLLKVMVKQRSQDELWEFWRHPTPGEGKNLPLDYLRGEERSRFLVELIKRFVEYNAKILEIGCNIGRNLNYLFNTSYTKLGGGN